MQEEKLPDAELEVLACIWKRGEATARDIREAMEPYRPMTHGSVVTLLKRLETKNLVKKRKGPVGKAFLFKAARKPNSAYRRLAGKLRDRVFGGDRLALVASLFETGPPTSEEIDDLQKMLDNLRAESPKNAKRPKGRNQKDEG